MSDFLSLKKDIKSFFSFITGTRTVLSTEEKVREVCGRVNRSMKNPQIKSN